MVTIQASCPDCGRVELTPDDVLLMVCNHEPLSYYAFDCPFCFDEVRKPADDHIVALMALYGVRAKVWQVPAEALEAKAGEPISYDDLLAFALDLDADDRLAARLQPRP